MKTANMKGRLPVVKGLGVKVIHRVSTVQGVSAPTSAFFKGQTVHIILRPGFWIWGENILMNVSFNQFGQYNTPFLSGRQFG